MQPSHRISDLQQLVHHEFRNFGLYLDTSHASFTKQLDTATSVRNQCLDSIAKLKTESGGEIDPESSSFGKWEDLNHDIWISELEIEAINDMLRVFNNSSFVFLISIFEGSLKRVCEVFLNSHKSVYKSIKEPSYIVKSRLFLSQIGLNMADEAKWEEVRAFTAIRNAIVHESASVSKKADRYQVVLHLKQHLEIHEDDDMLTFNIKEIRFIHKAADFLSEMLIQIGLNAIDYLKQHPIDPQPETRF